MGQDDYVMGSIQSIFFENPKNFYKVMLIRVEDTNSDFSESELVITGIFGSIHEDTPYQFFGNFVHHAKYGIQFSVSHYQQVQPTGESGLIRFLSSEKFPGIGEKTAKKIVDELGEHALEMIIEDEHALDGIKSLTLKKRLMIREVLIQSHGMESVFIQLANWGFPSSLTQKIIQTYKAKALEIIQQNPYQIVKDIEGIGFKRIDILAKMMQFPPNMPERIEAAVFLSLRDLSYQSGHTYILDKDLVCYTQKLLESSQSYLIEYEEIVKGVNQLIREGIVIATEDKLALAILYYSEIGISSSIERFFTYSNRPVPSNHKIQKAIQEVEKELGIQYDTIQKKALCQMILSPIFILTGGPGTGKTTIINGFVALYKKIFNKTIQKYLEKDLEPILLAAPTGRAAKRMSEVTDLPASTIHRLLGLTIDNEERYSDEDREIEGLLLIVDETSMIDTWLMNRLLKQIPKTMQLILVGDKNQLPSVGPGQVLADLLQTGRVPSVELKQVYRQENESTIISLAHDINQGNLPNNFHLPQKDRSFFSCSSEQVATVIEQVVKRALSKGFSKKEIQVLAPMYKGHAGIDQLNQVLQEVFNPNPHKKKREVEHFNRLFRVGDKVLQLVNLTEQNIFNGDIGEIVAIEWAKENEDQVDKLIVAFDQMEVEVPKSDWHQLTLAYCCSIHKAQGSEFRMVILPMTMQYSRMLRRNLLYTAVTRAKEYLIMCGQTDAFKEASQSQSLDRKTQLKELICNEELSESNVTHSAYIEDEVMPLTETESVSEIIEHKETKEGLNKNSSDSISLKGSETFCLTMELIQSQSISPMIGMETISPYQFMKE